jgi:hypothetical protein
MEQRTKQARNRNKVRSRSPHVTTTQEGYDLSAILKILPLDSRGWMVIEVASRPSAEAPMIVKLEVTMPNGIMKALELVRQAEVLKVNVNPDPLGFDEWIMKGQMFFVQSKPK